MRKMRRGEKKTIHKRKRETGSRRKGKTKRKK
jgi:hypothetical protein